MRTAGTLLAEHSKMPHYVKEQLGHAEVGFTMRQYVHLPSAYGNHMACLYDPALAFAPFAPTSAPSGAQQGADKAPADAESLAAHRPRRGAPSMIRTCDLLIRSQTLYPTELWARRRFAAGFRRVPCDLGGRKAGRGHASARPLRGSRRARSRARVAQPRCWCRKRTARGKASAAAAGR